MTDEETYTYEGWLRLREEEQAAALEQEQDQTVRPEVEFMAKLWAEEQSS